MLIMKLQKFLTSKGTLLAFSVTLIYGILVFLIYFTGYHAMPNHMNRLPVTIVNQDKNSKTVAHQVKASLSKKFDKVSETTNLSQAQNDLNARKTYLIVDIPHNFANDIQNNRATTLHFYVNESNPSTVVSTMKSVATTIGNTVQKKVIVQKSEAALTASATQQLTSQVQSLPAAQQQRAVAQVHQQVEKTYAPIANGVAVQIHRTNKVKSGLNYAMAPFFTNIAMYLSSLVGALLLYGTYAKFAKSAGRWKPFAAMQVAIILISAISTGIIKVTVMDLVGAPLNHFLSAWLGQFFVMWGSFELNSVFMLLLGQIGASVNIFFTMIQVVSSAGMVPVVTMNTFFRLAHYVSPLYYGAQMDFNTFYGGSGNDILLCSMIGLVISLLVINIVIVSFRKKQAVLNFENLS